VRQLQHPLSGAIYEESGDGHVLVTKDGRSGRFRTDGTWVDGDLRHADPHVCLWVGDKQLSSWRRAAGSAAAAAKGASS
jgi:hypothetical protein